MKKNFAILPVHVFGKIGNMDGLITIQKYNLKVVEDAAEALGVFIKVSAGNFGHLGILSLMK